MIFQVKTSLNPVSLLLVKNTAAFNSQKTSALMLPHLKILAPDCKQFLMRALLNDPAIFHHYNSIHS